MIVNAKKFSTFCKLVGIGKLNNFVINIADDLIFTSVASANNAVLLYVKMKAIVEENEVEEKVCLNADIIDKYLKNFNNTVTLAISEDVLTITDEKLTLYCPQIDYEVASKTIKTIREDMKEKLQYVTRIIFPIEDFKRIQKVANNLKEPEIKIVVENGEAKFVLRERDNLKLDAEVSGEDSEAWFRIDVLDMAIGEANALIEFDLPKQVDQPSHFRYEIDDIEVEGYIMPILKE